METYHEKTTVIKKKPEVGVRTQAQAPSVVHEETRAAGEIDNLGSEEPAGIFESLKGAAIAGMETVRDGVNYLAEQVTGASASADADVAGVHKTETTTVISPESHPDVEKRTRVVEAQTRYPNQQGYGVNPKFKDDADNGALADIKSGIKKGVENIKEKAKDVKEDVKQGAHELKESVKDTWEDVKIEGNRVADNVANPPRSHAAEARRLENKAEDLLDERDKDLKEARKAQSKADKKAAEAHAKTAKALNKQELGQEYLAGAGAERAAARNCGVHKETHTKTVNTPAGKKVETTTTERRVC